MAVFAAKAELVDDERTSAATAGLDSSDGKDSGVPPLFLSPFPTGHLSVSALLSEIGHHPVSQ